MKASKCLVLAVTLSLLVTVAVGHFHVADESQVHNEFEFETETETETENEWEANESYSEYDTEAAQGNHTEKLLSAQARATLPSFTRKYIVTLVKLNWYAANAFCEQNGWSLIHIETVTQQFQTLNYLNYFNLQSNDFWTGGNKLADLQNFRWSYEGPKFSYSNWGFGQPDNSLGSQHCVKLEASSLKWHDDFCENTYHFICQIDEEDNGSTRITTNRTTDSWYS
ncbi:C-type lectin 37Db isoform X1 [Ceratitis capitata]|uniref:C-type lectin 37Db isoform X1 n=1 Tax=Ceratitis capitata TaxID=7213 RepID=UPI0003297F9A|nr:C-type lectin 37Db isoform X1 [Ceratitis capitata]